MPVVGATVNFAAIIGTFSDSTNTTDVDGRAVTFLSSDEIGASTVTASYDSNSGLKEGTMQITFTEYDSTAPVFSAIASNINPANSGDILSITFDVSEALATNPSVKVDSNNATFASKVGLSYTYTYTITGNETEGVGSIDVSGADASNNVGNGSASLTLDFTTPSFTTNDGVASGPVKTDTINITVSDTYGVATSKYGYSADNTCNASDTYGNNLTSAVNFDITGNHTDYLCAEATDNAGNIGYGLIGQLNVDNTAPTATAQYPLDNAASVVITINPYIDFSEAMDGATLIAANVNLRKYSDNSVIASAYNVTTNGNGTTRLTFVPNSSLAYNTHYYFFIGTTVKDQAGNAFPADTWYAGNKDSHEFTTIAADVPVTTYNISLSANWNLVSLPLIPNSSTIATVLTGIVGNISNVNLVKYYNPTSGAWLSYVPGASGNTLSTMEDGKGYWIFMNAADTLRINGTELPAGGDVPLSYSVLGNKWNLMGFKSVENKTAVSYLGASSADDVIWQYKTGQYKNLISQSDNFEPSYGYWVYNNGSDYTVIPTN